MTVDGQFFNEDNGVLSTPKTETNSDTVSKRKRAKRKPTKVITSFYSKAATITSFSEEASPAEVLSPWRSRLGDTSITNRALCLHAIAVRAELTHFTPQLHPTSRFLLALIYMPGSSVTNEDHYDNATSRLVMEPILGRNYYTVEFVDLFISVNAWVDLKRVKLECNNEDSLMVRDYVDRLSHIIAYKEERGLLVDIYVGGPDTKAALRSILHGFTQVGSLSVFVRTRPLGNFITVTTAEYRPSYGIMSGKRDVQASIRDQFCLYKTVCAVSDVARSSCRPITEADITAELNEEHHRRIQMVSENLRVLDDFLQGNLERKQEVMDLFPSIGYNGVSWAVSTVTYLEESCFDGYLP